VAPLALPHLYNKDTALFFNGQMIFIKRMKNLIKKILKESEDEFGWIRDIKPISDGDDIFNFATRGDSFRVKVKEKYINNYCSDEYLIYGAAKEGTNVIFIDAITGVDVHDGDCETTGDGRGILLKFNDYKGHGHEGFLGIRTYSENEKIYDLCKSSCWWVHPQVIEVVNTTNTSNL